MRPGQVRRAGQCGTCGRRGFPEGQGALCVHLWCYTAAPLPQSAGHWPGNQSTPEHAPRSQIRGAGTGNAGKGTGERGNRPSKGYLPFPCSRQVSPSTIIKMASKPNTTRGTALAAADLASRHWWLPRCSHSQLAPSSSLSLSRFVL